MTVEAGRQRCLRVIVLLCSAEVISVGSDAPGKVAKGALRTPVTRLLNLLSLIRVNVFLIQAIGFVVWMRHICHAVYSLHIATGTLFEAARPAY